MLQLLIDASLPAALYMLISMNKKVSAGAISDGLVAGGGLCMRVLALVILLTSTLGAQATDYRRYISKSALPLHDILLKKQFLIIPDPQACKINGLIRGYFISRYRAIYLCVDNLLKDPRLGDIDGKNKFNDARKQLSTTLTHEAIHVAQWCKGSKDWTLFGSKYQVDLGGFGDTALNPSTNFRGNKQSEKEAYFLENKPKIAMEAIDIYCQPLLLDRQRLEDEQE